MVISASTPVAKETEQKHIRDDNRRQRRFRKLARRRSKPRKPRSYMPTYENSESELAKYANLAASLEADLSELALLHARRAEIGGQLEALKITRDRLNRSILDAEGPADVLVENLRGLETEKLVLEASSAALAPRIEKGETELHARLPLAIRCFGRLHGRLVTCIADTAKESVRKLLAPDHTLAEEHLNAIVIETPGWIEISRLQLPSLTHTNSRPLNEEQPHWSSLVRPFTPAEKAAQRAETVKALVDASNALVLAAGRLVELAAPYAERVPAFKCEPEVIEPAVVDPKFLEWQQPLGGSDADFVAQHCKEAGKDPNHLSDRDKAILAALIEERHKMPQSHGMLPEGAEMLGTTYQE